VKTGLMPAARGGRYVGEGEEAGDHRKMEEEEELSQQDGVHRQRGEVVEVQRRWEEVSLHC